MFLVDVGGDDGVREGAPVVSAHGLVGKIREVRPRSAVGMDWTYPDFRVSAMLVDGSAFGIVENVRGAFREEDRLMLNGTAIPRDRARRRAGRHQRARRHLPAGDSDRHDRRGRRKCRASG